LRYLFVLKRTPLCLFVLNPFSAHFWPSNMFTLTFYTDYLCLFALKWAPFSKILPRKRRKTAEFQSQIEVLLRDSLNSDGGHHVNNRNVELEPNRLVGEKLYIFLLFEWKVIESWWQSLSNIGKMSNVFYLQNPQKLEVYISLTKKVRNKRWAHKYFRF